ARDDSVFVYGTVLFFILFFFFQAEDGIRDATVTGVQTCALPILLVHLLDARQDVAEDERPVDVPVRTRHPVPDHEAFVLVRAVRSEERRVGKECRSRWSQ